MFRTFPHRARGRTRLACALFALLAATASAASDTIATPAPAAGGASAHSTLRIADAFADANGDRVFDHKGETVTVRGVLIDDPVAIASGMALADLEDDSGGVTVFTRQRDLLVGRVQRGDAVMATGRVSDYHGNAELVLTDIARVGNAIMPLPKVIRVSDAGSGRYDNELVRLSGTLEVPAHFFDDRKGCRLRDSTGAIEVLVSERMVSSGAFLNRLVQGGQVEIDGICNRYGKGNQWRILPRDENDVRFSYRPPYRALALGAAFAVLVIVAARAMVRRRRAEGRADALGAAARVAAEERDRFFTLSIDLLCVLTLDGGLKRLNPAFSRTLGWPLEAFTSRPLREFIHPEDLAEARAALQRLNQGETIDHAEIRCLSQSGAWRHITWHAVPQPGGLVFVTGRDVTDLRRTEAALRAVNEELEQRVIERSAEAHQARVALDAAVDGALIYDAETLQFTYVNEGALRQLGHTRAELLGMRFADIAAEYKEPDLRKLLDPLVRGMLAARQVTTVLKTKAGTTIPVEIAIQYMTRPAERPRFISMVRDLTERQKTEMLLRRSQRLDSLGTLAGGVAHDLNNALTPMLMSIDMLKTSYPDDRALLDTLHMSVQRGADMVQQLLTFAKRAEGKSVEIVVAALLDEIHQIARYTFPKHIGIEVRCPDKTLKVRGDPTQLHQVVLNLCVNARDAMPDGGMLMIEARAEELDESSCNRVPDAIPGRYAVIRVSDTGTGIPPEVIDRIFDPFFTTKAPDKGTGLGLSTTIGILKRHHGFVHVSSQVGVGSTFTVYVPALAPSEPTSRHSRAPFAVAGANRKVLVVDDEPAVRQTAMIVLRRLGFQVVLAADGPEALSRVAQHHDLRAMITDLHMLTMPGVALVQAMRQIHPALPILVMSGRMEPAERDACAAAGVQTFLNKPFTERQLLEALGSALEEPAAVR